MNLNKGLRSALVATLSLMLLLVLLCSSIFGQSTSAWTEIVEKASKSVVLFKGTTDDGTVLGSGFVLSTDGKIATNLHVIRGMKSGCVQLASGEIYDSFTVLEFDDRKDLAIVKIPGFDLPAIELGNSNDLKVGEPVMAIGSPHGLQGSVTTGVVSAVRNDPTRGGYKVIQTDAAVNHGNSGGPLLNGRGQVVGVITSKWDALEASEGLNFAVSINYVRGLMSSTDKPMALAELRAKLNSTPVDSVKGIESFPANWKSMNNGKRFKIRKEGDIVYVEGVLSDTERQVGTFTGMELRKSTNGYSGVERVVLAVYHNAFGIGRADQLCTFDFPIEVSGLTPSRIEGRLAGPSPGSSLDHKKCSYNKPYEWTQFVWIPE